MRAVFAVVAVAAPLIVAASRAYRGMHHPIDVVAGLLLGITALAVAMGSADAPASSEIDRSADDSFPERVSPARPHQLERTDDQFHVHRRDRLAQGRRDRPPPSRGSSRSARLGWVAKGVVYLVVGLLAVPIAIDGLRDDGTQSSSGEASQTGAVTKIAETSFGTVTLWVIAIGLALYVLWRLISILLPAENTAKAWLTRVGYLVSALVYSALAWTALQFAQHERLPPPAPRARTPRSSATPGS